MLPADNERRSRPIHLTPGRIRNCCAWGMAAVLCTLPMRAQFSSSSRSSAKMQSASFSCTTAAGAGTFQVKSWSWGEQITGTTTFLVNAQTLNIVKAFDNCSGVLAKSGATGTHFASTLTLQEFDKSNAVLATVVLTGASINQ